MYCLLKAGCVGLDMSGIGISKVEQNLKQAKPFWTSILVWGQVCFSFPAFSK